VSAWAAPIARAEAPLPAEPAADQRISAELSASLREEADSAFTWRVTWTAINGAVAIASVGGVFILPRDQQPSLIVGAISSGLSAALTWLLPLEVESDAERAEQLASLPPGQRRARLEELYAHSAQDESDRVQWPWHLVSVLTAVVPAAIIWIGWDQPQEATISLLTGLALGELALLTQPTSLGDRGIPGGGELHVAFTGRDLQFTYAITW
jgi:hypothetical protein